MNDVNKQDQNQDEIPELDFEKLEVVTALGRGAKGVVFLARNADDGEWLALKVISRTLIERKATDGDEYRRVCFEREVLHLFRHPLLPRLRGVLDTQRVVGYAIDYCNGRDLNTLRKKQTEKMFSDDVIRFYAAELVMALDYIHSLGIVYRDLKPENIMVQHNGHVMLVDFDLSTRLSQKSPKSSLSPSMLAEVLTESKSAIMSNHKKKKNRFFYFHRFCNSGVSPEDSEQRTAEKPRTPPTSSESDSSEKSNSFVGTEDYVAPEIVAGKGHDFAVDWWSLGVVLYEMLYGTTPFRGSNRKETFYRILTKTPDLCGEATPLRDLIRKLLEKDPTKRIDLEEIKGHDFFKGTDWDLVLEISRPPSLPEMAAEDMDGNNLIDVESFVQDVFCSDTEKKNCIPANHTESDRFHVF